MLIKLKQFLFEISLSPGHLSNLNVVNHPLNIQINVYKYLGLVLNEHLDYNVTAKYVAQSVTRALGLLISKFKQTGGMPFKVYKKLFDTTVWSVISSYGAAIWGTKEYSVINIVQNKACRFFIGVGKYTPNTAVNGDMG